jgi:hypothetical protein
MEQGRIMTGKQQNNQLVHFPPKSMVCHAQIIMNAADDN